MLYEPDEPAASPNYYGLDDRFIDDDDDEIVLTFLF